MTFRFAFALVGCLILPRHPSLFAQQDDALAVDKAGVEFFEAKIRPVLLEHCYDKNSDVAKVAADGGN